MPKQKSRFIPISKLPDRKGYFGPFGGRYMPETLWAPHAEIEKGFKKVVKSAAFQREFKSYLKNYAGRPTPLFEAKRFSKEIGARVFLKREDLAHTGAHKINNSLGQCLLAKHLGKKRIICETGAGQHGVATASVTALLGLQCIVYMGEEDVRRQALNVFRMRLLGAEVRPVSSGTKTLKDAINEAMRDWVTNVDNTFYCIGSVVGAHPFPLMGRTFQSVIGKETRSQILQQAGRLPSHLVACVGGGSNAIGLFAPFYSDKKVKMIGVEAGGFGIKTGKHAAPLSQGQIGILHGAKSYLMQDKDGQVQSTHSISAGLDYPSVGPEHAYYKWSGRAEYLAADDNDALLGFQALARTEGLIPALESSHAFGFLIQKKKRFKKKDLIVVGLSGRGDKDVNEVERILKEKAKHGRK